MKLALLAIVCLTGLGTAWAQQTPQEYRIGPEDLIEITVFEVPELSRSVRVSAGGEISLPLVGTVKAAGLSPMELERVLAELLRRSYMRAPQVSVFVKEYRSDPVSVVGAVKAPGLYRIHTQKSLIEVLAMAQGLSEGPHLLPGRTIVISRSQLRNSQTETPQNSDWDVRAHSPADWSETVEVPIKELLQSGDSKWNVPVYPGDVIKVVPAGTFYVAGDVNQPGGFPLTDFDYVTAMQAVAMAGGTKKSAKLKDAVIVRRDAAGNRIEEKIDLRRVFEGKVADVNLGANDILFVPGSVGKEAVLRAMEGAIQASMYLATGLLVWGR